MHMCTPDDVPTHVPALEKSLGRDKPGPAFPAVFW